MGETTKPITIDDIGEWRDIGFCMNFFFKPFLKGEKLKFATKWRSQFLKKGRESNKKLKLLKKQGYRQLGVFGTYSSDQYSTPSEKDLIGIYREDYPQTSFKSFRRIDSWHMPDCQVRNPVKGGFSLQLGAVSYSYLVLGRPYKRAINKQ